MRRLFVLAAAAALCGCHLWHKPPQPPPPLPPPVPAPAPLPSNLPLKEALNGDQRAVLELGRLGGSDAEKTLRQIRGTGTPAPGSAASAARAALAKLGDAAAFGEIVADLGSSDPGLLSAATRWLAYVGGDKSVKALVPLLSDDAFRLQPNSGPGKKDKVFIGPPSWLAIKAISPLVTDGPTKPGKSPEQGELDAWRQWLSGPGARFR